MNELTTLWNSYPALEGFSIWIMDMSLMNIGMFIFIILGFFGISLKVKINDNERNTPKHVLTLLTITLMFMYSSTLWIAALPYGVALLLTIFWQRPLFIYMNLFMPAGHKLNV